MQKRGYHTKEIMKQEEGNSAVTHDLEEAMGAVGIRQ